MKNIFIFLTFILMTAGLAVGQRHSHLVADLSGNFGSAESLLNGKGSLTKLRLDGRMLGKGRFRVVLKKRTRNDALSGGKLGTYALLQGTGWYRSAKANTEGEFPASATIVRDGSSVKVRLFLFGEGRTVSSKVHPAYEITIPVTAGVEKQHGRVSRARPLRSRPQACGNFMGHGHGAHHAVKESARQVKQPAISAATTRVLELDIVADSDWQSKHGGSWQSEIATIVNASEAIYVRDLSVSYDVKGIAGAAPGNFTSTDIERTFDQMIAYPGKNPNDLFHLFTSKNYSGLFGVAYDLGTICRLGDRSISFTVDSDPAENILTFAHEVGHNFGAEHTEASPPSIMYPTSHPQLQSVFNQTSKNQIGSFLNQWGTCLASGDGGNPAPNPTPNPDPQPTPTPDQGLPADAELDAFKARAGRATLLVADAYIGSDGIPGQSVEVLYRRRRRSDFTVVATMTTDEFGYAEFRLRKRGHYMVRYTARPETVSRIIRHRRRRNR